MFEESDEDRNIPQHSYVNTNQFEDRAIRTNLDEWRNKE
jgi:hypothetical protein